MQGGAEISAVPTEHAEGRNGAWVQGDRRRRRVAVNQPPRNRVCLSERGRKSGDGVKLRGKI